jgi:hypothetical protein
MLEGRFPTESQVGLFGVIANNFVKLAKANFGGVTISPLFHFPQPSDILREKIEEAIT